MGLIRAAFLALTLVTPATAETVRVATWSPALTRKGPGLLAAAIASGKDAQVAAAVQVIKAADADILLLTGFDWDFDGIALAGFATALDGAGAPYPHRFAARPNSGMATGLDLDGDGRTGTADDAQGFGLFTGERGMAILSRLPLGKVTDHTAALWRDLPGNLMPTADPQVVAVQRLSSTAHWDVPVMVGQTTLHLLTMSATPPVFDAEDDRNGRRNHDELAFWLTVLPDDPFVIIGDLNLDPIDGDGRPQAFQRILAHVQDPAPTSPGAAASPQTGANTLHKGDPARDTAHYPAADGPGNLRVDYVLPSNGLKISDAGVLWPAPGDALADTVAIASHHRLVWVDLDLP